MKVLFITSFLGRKEYGGAEISTRLLRTHLIASGVEVPALTTRQSVDNSITSINCLFEIPKKLLTLGNNHIDYYLSKKIRIAVELIKPDVLHIQDTYILPASVAANQTLKLPCVATVRNSVIDTTWDLMFPKPVSTLLKQRNEKIISSLQKLDCVIAVSDYIKGELTQRGVAAEKIVTIYNLPPTFPNLPQSRTKDSRVLLFAPGLLANFKGFEVLITAMKSVVEHNRNVHLTIVGDGPQKEAFKALVTNLNLESNITFTGQIEFTKLAEYYSNCDIVIFPSIYPEPFGRVALEAMYFSKPIIASKVGGIPEIITDKEEGFLVPPNDPPALSTAILTLAHDQQLRDDMGKNGQKLIKRKFSEEAIVQKHLKVYSSISK